MLKLNGPNDILWKVVRNQEAAQGLVVPYVHWKNKPNTSILCTLFYSLLHLQVFMLSQSLRS